jgi:hypothetical protein
VCALVRPPDITQDCIICVWVGGNSHSNHKRTRRHDPS